MTDREISDGLKGLRESVRGLEAGERVEAALVEAFRTERPGTAPPAAPWWPKWALAAAAAVLVAVAVLSMMRREDTPPVPVAVSQPPAVRSETPEPPQPQRVARPAGRPQVTTGEFIPLVPDLRWEPGESAQIMRVSFPREALQSFGFPVNENRASEMVRADILVGHDMVARAIRIVR
jgi:hypothetical protein